MYAQSEFRVQQETCRSGSCRIPADPEMLGQLAAKAQNPEATNSGFQAQNAPLKRAELQVARVLCCVDRSVALRNSGGTVI